MDKKYEISSIAIGGRNGHVISEDKQIDMDLSFPKELGGNGKSLNPEQLFSAGYAGCFSQATIVVASQNKIDISKVPKIKTTVQLFLDNETGFHVKVGIEGIFENWDQSEAEEFMIKCHKTCPYSKMIKQENILFLKANGKQINL